MLLNVVLPCVQLLGPQGWEPTRLLCLWDSPGENTGVGCHVLLQGIFPSQGLNLSLPSLLHCRGTSYCRATRESPFKV